MLLALVTGLLAVALLYLVALGAGRLDSRIGRMRDGFRPGTRIPPFNVIDSHGVQHSCPSGTSHQILLFVHHAVRSFPTVTTAIEAIRDRDLRLEVLLFTISAANITQAALDGIGLSVPVIVVQERFYTRYRVRQMPYCIIADADGRLLSSGNASSGDHLLTLWRRACAQEKDHSSIAEFAPTASAS
jgi:hypothetical protein